MIDYLVKKQDLEERKLLLEERHLVVKEQELKLQQQQQEMLLEGFRSQQNLIEKLLEKLTK